MEEMYISVDVEASGPIPGEYSMLSLGACVVDGFDTTFYTEIIPITDRFVPEALQVSGFSLDELRATGTTPAESMRVFQAWVDRASGTQRPVFVGFNACFDWAFVNWYFYSFIGENPFGIGGIDIKSYYMGLTGRRWSETTSAQLPAEFQPSHPQTHNALDDAIAQAQIFSKMLQAQTRQKT